MQTSRSCRFFISYTGVKLPLQLVNELEQDSLQNRITYFKASYDEAQRVTSIEKIVYGEIEFVHHYEYGAGDVLSKAVLIEGDEEPRTLLFDSQGLASEL